MPFSPFSLIDKHKPDMKQLLADYERWFASESGRQLLAQQQLMVDELTTSCFGYYLLQLGVAPDVELYSECRVQNKFRSHPANVSVNTMAEYEQLPFASESLDVVLLHHAQELSTNPHLLLRELQRVIVPRGHLILFGFNPWSPIGVYKQLQRFFPHSLWHNQLVSSGRMRDWLSLLGFDVQLNYYGQHFPAVLEKSEKPWVQSLIRKWPIGNFYVISAIKQDLAMTPLRPKWASPARAFGQFSPAKRSGQIKPYNALSKPSAAENTTNHYKRSTIENH
mgnify:CR=1 FL=1